MQIPGIMEMLDSFSMCRSSHVNDEVEEVCCCLCATGLLASAFEGGWLGAIVRILIVLTWQQNGRRDQVGSFSFLVSKCSVDDVEYFGNLSECVFELTESMLKE
jgi:hypothetical protein